MRKQEMSDKEKTKLAYIWGGIALICSAVLWMLTMNFSDQVLPWFLGVTTLLYGPIVAVLYLREVKNGVFDVSDEED